MANSCLDGQNLTSTQTMPVSQTCSALIPEFSRTCWASPPCEKHRQVGARLCLRCLRLEGAEVAERSPRRGERGGGEGTMGVRWCGEGQCTG